MAFGEILRNARLQKGLTPSDVAESTHMLVQVVESLEQEDFRRIAAPIYGRGFVKLYAELLELAPEPLVSDFMNLYSGARAPAVLTKKVESLESPAPLPAPPPVTRTVGAPAPQRQAVQPRPVVRPVTVADETPSREMVAVADGGEPAPVLKPPRARIEPVAELAPAVIADASDAKKDFRPALAVEPEEPCVETDGLDLFRAPASQGGAVAVTVPPADEGRAEKPGKAAHRPKHPIFQIGGRAAPREVPEEDQGGEAQARRHARIQAFVDGFTKLRSGVERRLPVAWPRRQVLLLGGAGLGVAVLMLVGIGVLFKLTGANVKKPPVARFERIAPPPPLYVD
jgi:transcriptional regulator with XRE-family HTH domain